MAFRNAGWHAYTAMAHELLSFAHSLARIVTVVNKLARLRARPAVAVKKHRNSGCTGYAIEITQTKKRGIP
jgi:hypothetical protein